MNLAYTLAVKYPVSSISLEIKMPRGLSKRSWLLKVGRYGLKHACPYHRPEILSNHGKLCNCAGFLNIY